MNDPTRVHNCIFDWNYSEEIELRDGTQVRLRLLRSEDRDKLREGFEQLSPKSRYRRFLSTKQRLTPRELDYLSDVDQYDHVALGAELCTGPHAGKGIAIARCIREHDDSGVAETAVTVADEFQHRGLGKQMFERLAAAAREREVSTFRAMLFSDNDSMHRLLEQVGDEVQVVERAGAVVTVATQIDEQLPEDKRPKMPRVPEDIVTDEQFADDFLSSKASSPDGRLRSMLSTSKRRVASLVEKLPRVR